MKISLVILFLLLSCKVLSQVIVVVDEQNKPLPYFTLTVEGQNRIFIGDKNGHLSLPEADTDCGYSIRYIGYKDYSFCSKDLKIGNNRISLELDVFDLLEAEIVGLSDEDLILNAKSFLAAMSDGFNLTRAFTTEKSENSYWESFGVLTLAGLKDRNKKNARFDAGNMAFLSQHSRFWALPQNNVPFSSSMSVVSTFTQDLLFEVLKSKNARWSFDINESSPDEMVILDELGVRIQLTGLGNPIKMIIQEQEFMHFTGETYQVKGTIDFIQDGELMFFSEMNFDITKKNRTVNVSCVVLDFPRNIQLPEAYSNRSKRDALMNSFGSYTRQPDYQYDFSVFNKLIKTNFPDYNSDEFEDFQLLTSSYTPGEKYVGDDPSSKRYLEQNSEFIRAVFKTLKEYELTW
ncbi:peptidase associated/transthyretin-like domain-containing protein [Algoriphagus marinus]|uniref:hypothetical protein n=1 Tax=Algoriphagus marinus TaxID=1925762 RepID=UPI00094B969D|nr:hypothetical protein [Algoriphagus marinus]